MRQEDNSMEIPLECVLMVILSSVRNGSAYLVHTSDRL